MEREAVGCCYTYQYVLLDYGEFLVHKKKSEPDVLFQEVFSNSKQKMVAHRFSNISLSIFFYLENIVSRPLRTWWVKGNWCMILQKKQKDRKAVQITPTPRKQITALRKTQISWAFYFVKVNGYRNRCQYCLLLMADLLHICGFSG